MKPLNKRPQLAVRTLLILFLLAVAFPAAAEVHRISDTQTGWYYYYNQTAAEITDIINETESRLIDIEVTSVSPLRFTAAFVRNAGEYASGWWWYYGLTYNDVVNAINENTGRLIDIEPYTVDGEMRYAVVMVPNTGDQQKAWWWLVNAGTTDIEVLASRNNARLVDIESYFNPQGQRVYAAVFISNTGEDYAPWGWFYNTPAADVTAWMNENNMRVLEFEMREAGSSGWTPSSSPRTTTDRPPGGGTTTCPLPGWRNCACRRGRGSWTSISTRAARAGLSSTSSC